MTRFATYLSVLAMLTELAAVARAELPPDVAAGLDEQCLKTSDSQSPDSAMDDFSFLPKRIKAASDVVFHSGATTDRDSNAGIVAYVADTANTDDKFFALSVRFLKKVKEIDKKEGHDYKSKIFQATEDNDSGSKVNIDEVASTDVFQLALSATGGNQYWALRLMAAYGHDDERNKLSAVSSSCRTKYLDTLKPKANSVLYRPGSMGKLGYSKSFIDSAKRIAKACSDSKFTLLEKALCNDNVPDYRADYYHLITSAFLKCRRTAIDNASDLGASLVPAVTVPKKETVDALYLSRVHQYKVDRFYEEIKEMPRRVKKAREDAIAKGRDRAEIEEALPDEDDLIDVVKKGLSKIEDGAIISGSDFFSEYAAQLSPARLSAAKAILARYEFEVAFRAEQHTMGMTFGNNECKGLKSLKLTQGELEKACLR